MLATKGAKARKLEDTTLPPPYTITEKSRNVHIIDIPVRRNGEWEAWFLLSADRHFDNAHSDHALQRQHLDEARQRRAAVLDFGDLFCAMQGPNDPRQDKSQLRREDARNDYFDSIHESAVRFFAPYAENLFLVIPGNHDSNVERRHGTNLTRRLVTTLRDYHKSPVALGGYSGWIKLRFTEETKGGSGAWRDTRDLYYEHGHGGGGEASKGSIQAHRRSAGFDADLFVSGHTHHAYSIPNVKTLLSPSGVITKREEKHISLPTYKDEYADGYDGYHIEKGRKARPIGATWLRFGWCRRKNELTTAVIDAR